jgi:hypothetical protein
VVVKIKNPRIEIKIFATETITINDRSQDPDEDLFIDCEIEKSLDEEPNTATLTIYNLNESTQQNLVNSEEQWAPIEIYITPGGLPEKFVFAFGGEIETVENLFVNPGHETTIHCVSQQENHRTLTFRNTYKKGTRIGDIVNDMIEAVNLPRGNIESIPNTEILISESFSGPAFPILQRYVFDMGMYAYIIDGKIHITDAYEIANPTVSSLNPDLFVTHPEPTKRIDKMAIAMKTVTESRDVNPFAKRRKRKTKETKVVGKNDYVAYQAIDKTIEGIHFITLCAPDVNPDDIIPYDDKLFRVMKISHDVSTDFGGEWNTEIEADVYEDQGGDLRTRIEAERGYLVEVPASVLRGQN